MERKIEFQVTLRAVLLGALVATASSAAELAVPSVPNFHQVDERLYRGGQPGEGGIAALRALGIKTIVNLRYEKGRIAEEEAEARALGMNFISIPMYGLTRPKDEQIARILELIDDPENGPVFVHCAAGRDRAGVVVACYRVARCGWTAEDAIREARGYGMLTVEWAKRAYVRDYAFKRGGGAAVTDTGEIDPD